MTPTLLDMVKRLAIVFDINASDAAEEAFEGDADYFEGCKATWEDAAWSVRALIARWTGEDGYDDA